MAADTRAILHSSPPRAHGQSSATVEDCPLMMVIWEHRLIMHISVQARAGPRVNRRDGCLGIFSEGGWPHKVGKNCNLCR